MTTALSIFLVQVDAMVSGDDNELVQADREAQIKLALERYSRDFPDIIAEDVAGDGGKYYPTAGLTSWIDDFSAVVSVEFPAEAVSADSIPVYLEKDDYIADYLDGANLRYIFFPNHAPGATETIRLNYTAPYVFAGAPLVTTTPAQHFFAICNLSASMVCEAISTSYARIGASLINADSTSSAPKSVGFAGRATRFMKLYQQQMGLGTPAKESNRASVSFATTKLGPSQGQRYLFHK